MGMLIGLCKMIVAVGMRHGMRMRCAVVRVGKGVVMRVRVTVEQRIINDKGGPCLIIPHSGKHESAGRKTSIRGEENADSRKERSNSPKERTSCKIMQRRILKFTRMRP